MVVLQYEQRILFHHHHHHYHHHHDDPHEQGGHHWVLVVWCERLWHASPKATYALPLSNASLHHHRRSHRHRRHHRQRYISQNVCRQHILFVKFLLLVNKKKQLVRGCIHCFPNIGRFSLIAHNHLEQAPNTEKRPKLNRNRRQLPMTNGRRTKYLKLGHKFQPVIIKTWMWDPTTHRKERDIRKRMRSSRQGWVGWGIIGQVTGK